MEPKYSLGNNKSNSHILSSMFFISVNSSNFEGSTLGVYIPCFYGRTLTLSYPNKFISSNASIKESIASIKGPVIWLLNASKNAFVVVKNGINVSQRSEKL